MNYIKYLFVILFADIQKYYKKLGVKIGENCSISRNVSFGSEPYLIQIGDNVKITNQVRFITHDGGVYVLRNMSLLPDADIFGKIIIGNNVFIGNNVTILPNVTIGNNVVIGTGAVVTKNIPSNSVVAGIPAKKIKSIQEYCEKLKDKADYTKSLSPKEKKDYLINKYLM